MTSQKIPVAFGQFDTDKLFDCDHNESVKNLLRKSTSEPSDLDFVFPINCSLQNLVENFEKEVWLLGSNTPSSKFHQITMNGIWNLPSDNHIPLTFKKCQDDEEGSIKMADEDVSSIISEASTEATCSSCGRRRAAHATPEEDDLLDVEGDEFPPEDSNSLIPTADDVITEIDQIMSMSNSVGLLLNSSYDDSSEELNLVQMELRHFKEKFLAHPSECPPSHSKMDQHLQRLSLECLRYYGRELQGEIETLNGDLLQELRQRDDCECLKEVMEEFISLMNNVQRVKREIMAKRQKDMMISASASGMTNHNNDKSRKRWSWAGLRLSSTETNKSVNDEFQKVSAANCARKFIGLTIPYHASTLRLDMPTLLMFNKCLKAIMADDANVTDMLTEYILKDYLPSSVSHEGSESQNVECVPSQEFTNEVSEQLLRMASNNAGNVAQMASFS